MPAAFDPLSASSEVRCHGACTVTGSSKRNSTFTIPDTRGMLGWPRPHTNLCLVPNETDACRAGTETGRGRERDRERVRKGDKKDV